MSHHYLNIGRPFAAVFLVYALCAVLFGGLLAGQPSASAAAPEAAVTAKASGARYPYVSAVCEYGRAGGPYCVDPRNPGNAYAWGYWRRGRFDPGDPWGYEYRNCTSYVAWRLSRSGVPWSLFSDLGDASQWIAGVSGVAGVDVNHVPSPGAVAVWNSAGVGHVAWVVAVHGSRVTVDDYNYEGTGRLAQHVIGTRPSGYLHFFR
jgi:hypothetical protein